jgi:hypothetical protein
MHVVQELVAEVMDGNAFGTRGEQWLFAQVVAIGMLMFPPLAFKVRCRGPYLR